MKMLKDGDKKCKLCGSDKVLPKHSICKDCLYNLISLWSKDGELVPIAAKEGKKCEECGRPAGYVYLGPEPQSIDMKGLKVLCKACACAKRL